MCALDGIASDSFAWGGRHAAMKTEQEFIVDGRTAFTIYKTVDKISNRK